MKRRNKNIMLAIFAIAVFIFTMNFAVAADKLDYLEKRSQYCGLTECYTEYVITNPDILSKLDVKTFDIASSIEYKGEVEAYHIEFWNGTSWTEYTEIKVREADAKDKDKTKLKTATDFTKTNKYEYDIELAQGEQLLVRVRGTIKPIIQDKTLSYSIDHIPALLGTTYPEYDLWNQSYNRCVDVNVTYDLGPYLEINETFPVRITLNGTFVNLSLIKSDWGDVRFGNGTCADVNTDYLHNFVFTNTTEAYAVFYAQAGDIQNNTPLQLALFYNNTAATHTEPAAATAMSHLVEYAIWTHDVTGDDGAQSATATNDVKTLSTFNIATIVNGGQYYRTKSIGDASLLNYTPVDQTGYAAAMTVTFDNWNQTGTQYLVTMQNESDLTNTGRFTLSYVAAQSSGNSVFYDNASIDTFANMGWNNVGGGNVNAYSTDQSVSPPNSLKQDYVTSTATYNPLSEYQSELAAADYLNLSYYFYDNMGVIESGEAIVWMGLKNSSDVSSTSNAMGLAMFTGSCNIGQDKYMFGNGWDCPSETGAPSRSSGWHFASITYNKTSGDAALHIDGVQTQTLNVLQNQNMTALKFLSGGGASTFAGYYDDILLCDENSCAGGSLEASISLTAHFDSGTVTRSANVGVLENNVKYPLAFNVRRTSSSGLYIALIFNQTVYADDHIPGLGGQRENASTDCVSDYCPNYITFGGIASSDATGTDIESVSSTFNGSMDEIILGVASLGNTSRMGAPLLYAWGEMPAISVGETLISNLFPPVVSLSVSPSNPTFADDTLASVNYTDADGENGTVTIQWRVNGSIVRTVDLSADHNDVVSDTLGSSNYSKGATLNVTTWAFDGLYYSGNFSYQVIVGGIKPDPVTNLACDPFNKTLVNCTWTNPAGDFNHTNLYVNGSLIDSVDNTTQAYDFGGLFPGYLYNFTLRTVSSDLTQGNDTTNLTTTLPNFAPNITGWNPFDLSPSFEENTTQQFSVNATDDDGTPFFTWFLDGVKQAVTQAWDWFIGLAAQGEHNVTVIVNDTYGAEVSLTWNVTVNDTFPAPTTPVFEPNGGLYRTYIPVSCVSTNTYAAVSHYDIDLRVDNGSWENLSRNNLYGFVQFDITQYNYTQEFEFNCTARGESGNTSSVSNIFTKEYVNEFYATMVGSNLDLESGREYIFSLYYDAQNPGTNITIKYAYSDCNGDGEYDYVYNYTGILPSRVKQYYKCVFPKGQTHLEIGVLIEKQENDDWLGSGCNADLRYSNECAVRKRYTLNVA